MWRIKKWFCFSILLILDLCPWKSMLTYWCWSCLSSCFPCRSSECDGVTLCDTSWQLLTDGEWSGGSKTRSASHLTPQWLPDYGAHHSPLRTAFRKYFHFKFSLSHAQGALLAVDLLNIQISGVFASAGWPSGYLSSPNIRYNLPFLPSRHLTLNLKPKLLGIVQWPGCECGNQEGGHNGLKYELTNWSVYHSLVTAGQELDTGQQTPFSDHFCAGELGRGGPPWHHLAPGGQTCPFYLPQLPWECWKNHFACQCQEFS